MSHDTDTDTNATPDRGERIQRLRQAMRHPKILAADGWYTQEDDRIAPTDREYIAACDPATISELLSELDRETKGVSVTTTCKRYSMCLNVEVFMRNERYPEGYDIFSRDDGTPLQPHEALQFLVLAKAKGHKVIPCSKECGRPCSHEDEGCTGFDFSGGGCPGYSIPQPE